MPGSDLQRQGVPFRVLAPQDRKLFGVNFADGRIKGYGMMLHGSDKTFYVMVVRGDVGYGKDVERDDVYQYVNDASFQNALTAAECPVKCAIIDNGLE